MVKQDEEKDRPTHAVEPSQSAEADEKSDDHEVEPPKERVDDEVGSDEAKTTKRQK